MKCGLANGERGTKLARLPSVVEYGQDDSTTRDVF